MNAYSILISKVEEKTFQPQWRFNYISGKEAVSRRNVSYISDFGIIHNELAFYYQELRVSSAANHVLLQLLLSASCQIMFDGSNKTRQRLFLQHLLKDKNFCFRNI